MGCTVAGMVMRRFGQESSRVGAMVALMGDFQEDVIGGHELVQKIFELFGASNSSLASELVRAWPHRGWRVAYTRSAHPVLHGTPVATIACSVLLAGVW